MPKKIALIALAVVAPLFGSPALATTCPSSNITLANGTTADVTPLNTNFANLLSCANTYLAPLESPHFTGSVGIGTASPPNKLTIADGGSPYSGGTGRLLQLFSNGTGPVEALFGNTNNGFAVRATISSGSANQRIGFVDGGGIEDLIVTGQGNVGIGTTNPFQKLDVRLTSPASTAQPATISNGTGDNHTALFLNFSDGAAAQIGSKIGIQFGGYQTYGIGGIFGVMTTAGGTTQGDLTFDLKAGAYDSTLTERMRITAAGNVGIGTASPAVTLTVVGDIRVGTSGTYGCLQNFAGTGLIGTCNSDSALKIVRGNVSGVLDKFANLQLVRFNWNQTAAAIYHNSTSTLNTGFIAQAVELQFPELVSRDAHGYRQLDYSSLSLYGLEAIKELKIANDRQAAEIVQLQAQLGQMERRLAGLEARMSTRTAANDDGLRRRLRQASMVR